MSPRQSPVRVKFFQSRVCALLLACGFVALAGELKAQISIMPLGDSITAGGGAGEYGPGYRGVLYNSLSGNSVSFSFQGVNTHANGPTTGLPSLPAGYLSHNGYGGYTLANINANLAANNAQQANQGGFWITGGNTTTNGSGDPTPGPLNRPAVFPDIVLLMGGTNDADYSYSNGNGTVGAGYGLAAMQSSMDSILNWFKTNRPNTTLLVGSVVPWNKYGDAPADFAGTAAQIVAFNSWLKTTELPAFPKYRLVDINPLFLNSDGTTNTSLMTDTSDGIHPNPSGYILVANAWNYGLMGLGVIPKWKGDATGNSWSVGGAVNFSLFASGGTTSNVAFAQNNAVYFDDSGSNTPAVALSGALTPLAVTVNATQPYTFSGAGSLGGAMVLTKDGTGTLTLATNNTYSGGTVIIKGAVQVGAGGSAGSLGSGTVTISDTLAFNRSDTATTANRLTGPGAVSQIGSGATMLTGTNDYSGLTTISAGSLQIGNGGAAGSIGSGAVLDNANLTFNRSDNVTVYNPISGTGSLTKLGSGVLTLSAGKTYTGATIVSGGTLKLQVVPPLPSVNLIYQLSAATPSGYTLTGSSVTTLGDLSGNGNNFTATAANGPTVLTGTNGINGLGALHFSGASENNKLVLAVSTTPESIFIVNRPAATAQTNGNWGQNGGTLNGIWGQSGADYGIRLANSMANAWIYAGGNGNDYVHGGVGSMWINGATVASTANGSFVASSAHILEAANGATPAFASTGLGSYFSGSNRAYVGDIGEVLAYSTVLSLTDRQAVETYLTYKWLGSGGASQVLSGSTAVSLTQSGAALDLNGVAQPIASLTGVAGSKVYLGGAAFTVGNGANTTFAGAITDAGGGSSATGGSLIKNGAGTLALSGANTWAGSTQINNGTLLVTGSLNTTGATIAVGNGAILNVAGGAVTAASIHVLSGGKLISNGTLNASVINDSGGTIASSSGQPLGFNGAVINNGLVQLTGGSSLISSGSFTNNGTLDLITGSQTLPAGFVNNGVVLTSANVSITSINANGADFSVNIPSYTGHDYQLQRSSSLTAPNWQNIGSAQGGNTGSILGFSDPGGVFGSQGFYRIQVAR